MTNCFRQLAKQQGCPNVDGLGDLSVWYWLRQYRENSVVPEVFDRDPDHIHQLARQYFNISY